MIVRDLADDPDLDLEVIVEGDLSLQVRWVHVTELLDPSPYVKGGEFVLSAGIWNARGDRAEAFVGALARTGAVGLGWGLLDNDEGVPEEVVLACRSVGLTLLAVPTRTPFIAVGRKFFEHVQSRREANLRATIERNERLVRSISSLPGGLRGILHTLRESVSQEMWILRGGGSVVAATRTPAAEHVSAVAGELAADEDQSWAGMDNACVFPAGAGVAPVVYLVVDAPEAELDADERTAIEQALPLIEFVLAHEQELLDAERRLAAELVDAVFSRRTQFSAGRLRAYGMDPEEPLVGAIVMTGDPESALDRMRRATTSLGGDAVVAVWQGSVTAVVQPRRGSPTRDGLGRALHEALGAASAVGVGSESAGVEGLRRSLIQARQAASLALRRSESGGYVLHERVESHALLLALQDEEVLRSFRESLLGPIQTQDARRGTELLPTLEAFLACDCQWQATADRLRVHVNTIRHRLARCEQLTGRSLSSIADRVDFYIATRTRETYLQDDEEL